jgi:hypothetical protein
MVSCAGRFARLFRDVEARAAYNQDAKSDDFAPPAMPEWHHRNALVRMLRKSRPLIRASRIATATRRFRDPCLRLVSCILQLQITLVTYSQNARRTR